VTCGSHVRHEARHNDAAYEHAKDAQQRCQASILMAISTPRSRHVQIVTEMEIFVHSDSVPKAGFLLIPLALWRFGSARWRSSA
jgi:hypothetical protein